jgi:hypothetical protein
MTNDSNIGVAKKQAPKISFPDLTLAEWAQIAPDKVIVATETRAWLYQSRSTGDRFTQPMSGAGSILTTRKLLDGAIAAAQRTVNSHVRPPALTATRWVWRLAGAYHLCHVYPPLIEKAAKKFAEADRYVLAQWAIEKAQEETGHDLLALRDIQALGYDAQAVVKILVPPAAKVLMDYFTRSIQDNDPIDCVGYSYTMERLAMGVDEGYIQKVEKLLPSHTKATRCLRVHSSVGADAEHVEETVEMVAELTAKERVRIARACYETALMCFSPPQKGYITDELLRSLLNPLKFDQTL